MTNARFREVAPGVTVELVATRTELLYTLPNAAGEGENMVANWWAQEHLPVGLGYEPFGARGERLTTRLAEHAETVLEAGTDPVTGVPIRLSYAGAVNWLKRAFDHQANLQLATAPAPPAPDPEQ